MNKHDVSTAAQWCNWCGSLLPAVQKRPRRITRIFVGGRFYCATGPQDKFGMKNVTNSCVFKEIEANK